MKIVKKRTKTKKKSGQCGTCPKNFDFARPNTYHFCNPLINNCIAKSEPNAKAYQSGKFKDPNMKKLRKTDLIYFNNSDFYENLI